MGSRYLRRALVTVTTSPTMSALELQGLLSIGNPTIQRPSSRTCYWDELKTATVNEEKTVGNSLKATKAALPAAYVILAGPIISCLPLGSLAPILSILVTSFASTCLDEKSVGIAVVLIQGCGLCGFEGRILALLSFLSFSSTLDKLQASSNGLSSSMETMLSTFAGTLLSAYSALLVTLQAIAFATRGPCMDAFMISARSIEISQKRPSLGALTSLLLAQTSDDSYSTEGYAEDHGDSSNLRQDVQSDMSHEAVSIYSPRMKIHEVLPEDLLESWETVKEQDGAQKDSCSDGIECRNRALIDEINRLIDECDGISTEEWHEIIAALD